MTFAAVAVLFVLLCAGVEVLARRARLLSAEIVRKLAHMSAAGCAALLPLVLGFSAIALLGVLFAGLMALSQRLGILSAIHGVSRRTYGEVLFPLGIAALALVCPSPTAFAYGVLVLGLGDGLAALVGQRFGRRRVPLFQTSKTLWGTAAFVGACFVVGSALLVATGAAPAFAFLTAGVLALVLAPVELVLDRGFDNLALPLLAGLLITGL